MKKLKWQSRDDGVIYCDPIGLIESYYIYPPNYDDNENQNYIFSVIDNNGRVLSEKEFMTSELAQSEAVEKLKLSIELLNSCYAI